MSMAEIFSTVFQYAIMLLVPVCWILLIIRWVKSRHAAVRTVGAMVADKYKAPIASNIQGAFKRERYVVVFLAGEEKLAFDVSAFSFGGYELGERGTLKYKGNRIIDFH